MTRIIIPIEDLKRMNLFCPTCDRMRKFKPDTGVMANPFIGRIVQYSCMKCGFFGLVQG